ncbi:DUF2809 domain-containing protein [Ruminiclostridium herbifermentans]|uniref:DUF2809 domain-containing protein n=1 Tax=Ruminiclostridium herbifermentans TaxID=2488810 RepID=A0A4U7JIC8_9FIRM|nr:DUF2809 domain-containing protein [Ruminiclostridium herbifermentans]QNU65470.1 DUF2809 domain-containing protein [Ruminiclostridium herbifermentans]
MKINKKYLFAFICLLIIEIIIALFVHDKIIRPYFGDFLVVILLYTMIRAFIGKPIKHLPLYIFLFAFVVEMAQYFRIIDILNLRDNKFAATIMGTSFDIKDILCYLAGTIALIIWERWELTLKC